MGVYTSLITLPPGNAVADLRSAYCSLYPPAWRLSQKERAEIEGIEDRIFAAEDKVTTIETRMNDPEFQLNHYEKIPAEMEKLEAARATTTALYTRWEELQAIADAAE